MKRSFLTLVFLVLIGASVGVLTVGDVVLTIPVAAKTLLPLALGPEMFSDPGSLPTGIVAIGLYTVPNTILLYHVYM